MPAALCWQPSQISKPQGQGRPRMGGRPRSQEGEGTEVLGASRGQAENCATGVPLAVCLFEEQEQT